MGKFIVPLIITIIAYVIMRIIDSILGKIFAKTEFDVTLEKFVQKSTSTILWMITRGIIHVTLGVDLSAVIASLAIMGFIIGFALKGTLGNLVSGVMILMTKPFIVGDEIEVAKVKGKVKIVSIS